MAINSDIVSIRQGANAFDETNILNETGHKNMLHLIHLRWLAVGGQIATILVATWGLDIQLPLFQMLAVMVCLIAFNIGSHLRWHEERVVSNRELFLAMLVDIASLTAQLYFTGGINNPFVFLFLLQVILSAVLLRAESTWTVVWITTLCLAFLSVFNKPLVWPPESTSKLSDFYATGIVICFVLNAALLVIFITRIGSNLRAGDATLATMRQRAAEEEHIVRMGLWPVALHMNWVPPGYHVSGAQRLEAHAPVCQQRRHAGRNRGNRKPVASMQKHCEWHLVIRRGNTR